MALGMTKDSMLDLQGLVQEKIEHQDDGAADTVSLLTTGQSQGSKLEYNKFVGHGPSNPAADIKEEEQPPPSLEMEESTKSRDSSGGENSDTADGATRLAAPQETQDSSSSIEEEKKQDPSSSSSTAGQYAGFATDYDDYKYDPYQMQYHHNTPQTILGGPKSSSGGFLCCLFPWLRFAGNDPNSRIKEEEPDHSSSLEKTKTSNGPLEKSSSLGEDDDASTGELSAGSDKLGEKLSEKDRQAVLARLGLAQPDGGLNSPGRSGSGASDPAWSPGSPESEKPHQKGLLDEIPDLPLQGHDIKSDMSTSTASSKGILKRQTTVVKTPEAQNDPAGGRRRSLFPTYETPQPKENNNRVSFSPMARVVTIKSQKEMTPEDKSSVWWQRWDYEDFRKTGRIITRAMLEGGSEIWLASNQSWQHLGASKTATLKNAMTLSERAAKNGTNGATTDFIRTTGDKWWHKFGHSRRGLEHIASIKEGSERQANVRHAIRLLLDEQRRQKTYLREDPEKLRMVSIHNTSWARDLALAAGHSDADAVKSNFEEERKSREFYLLKMARSNSISSQGKHVPAFMKPAMSSFSPKLDANTSAQLMYRRKQQRKQIPAVKKDKIPAPANRSMEPIHDPENDQKDLARRAAGFSHDGAEPVNMAAVLSGMGAVPKIAQPV